MELLEEAVSPAEVREILERLGQDEAGGPDVARIKDVVEATGAPAALIGRMLADIRKDDWEEKFGLRQAEVEEQVRAHKAQLDSHERLLNKDRSPKADPFRWTAPDDGERPEVTELLDKLDDREVYEAVQREGRRRTWPALAIAIPLTILLLLAIRGCAEADQREREADPFPGSSYEQPVGEQVPRR